jgi:acyl-[acyl carrier protein]--UDP-N-acetylglucosamine O-acyltransferase
MHGYYYYHYIYNCYNEDDNRRVGAISHDCATLNSTSTIVTIAVSRNTIHVGDGATILAPTTAHQFIQVGSVSMPV